MTQSTVRFGLLGAAAITPLAMVTPAREVDGVSLDVIAARDPARAQEFAETHGIHRVSDHYQAVIDDPDIDAVYIALPISGLLERRAILFFTCAERRTELVKSEFQL